MDVSLMDNAKRTAAMRSFLSSLVDSDAGWTWIGRTAYLNGEHGIFKLALWSDGCSGHVAGLELTFTSHAGARDTMVIAFEDVLVSTNSTKNANYRGEAVRGYEDGWQWHIAKPERMDPLHDATRDWMMIQDRVYETMAREDAQVKRKKGGR